MNSEALIYVIDDDEDDFLIVEDILKSNFPRATISWIQDPNESEAFFSKHKPDLLIVDYNLGKLSGIDFIKNYRKQDSTTGIILLTGLEVGELDIEASEIGASNFISKNDLSPKVLTMSVRFTLEGTKQKRKIQSQKEKLESIMSSNKISLWSKTGDEHPFVSTSIYGVSGYSKEDFNSGKIEWIDIVHPDDKKSYLELLEKSRLSGYAKGSYRIKRKNETTIYVEEQVYFEYKNEIESFQGKIQDISELHQQLEEIQLLASAVEHAIEGVIITDANLSKPGPTIIYANRAVEKITGYSVTELVGQSPRIFQGPKTDRETLDKLKKQIKDGKFFTAKAVNYKKNGEEYVAQWSIRPLFNSERKITHYISTQVDITKENEQRQQLLENKQFLTQIGENAKVGGWRYNQVKDSLYWSDIVYKIYGKEIGSELNVETVIETFTEESRPIITKALDACLTSGKSYNLNLGVVNYNGKKIWVHTTGYPVYEDGCIVGAWGTFQDITEWHKTNFELKTLHSYNGGISCILNLSGKITKIAGEWKKLTEYKDQELEGISIFSLIHPNDIETIKNPLSTIQEDKEIKNIEHRLKKKNGNFVDVLCNASYDSLSGNIYVILNDISEIKEKERQLTEALKEAQIANQTKNQFLMVISHELRTPLNPIAGYADLLSAEIENPEHMDMLETIKSSANHLTQLIDDILDISSIESGKSSIQEKQFNLYELLLSCHSLMKSRFDNNGIQFEFKRSENLDVVKEYDYIGDPKKIRQVIFNLINNALKFTSEGRVFIDLTRFEITGEKAEVEIAVCDTGIGIKEEDKSAIFKKFHQVKMTTNRNHEGLGLGLALSKEFANLMEGDIHVDSTLGKGSQFYFTFKVEVSPKTIKSDSNEEIQSFGTNNKSTKKILVVEDDPVNQKIITSILKRLNIAPVVAENGSIAVEICSKEAFDTILMDIQMPVMNGFEATTEIRKSSTLNKQTPIYALTAHAIDTVKNESTEVGMNGFLEKPINLKKLKSALNTPPAS